MNEKSKDAQGVDENDDETRLSALMRKSQGGDQAAYRVLLLELMTMLKSYMNNLLVRWRGSADQALAEDLAQDVLLAIHGKRHTYDPAQRFLPWFYAVARHRAIDRLRSLGAERRVIDQVEFVPEHVDGDLESFSDGVQLDIETALSTLPENQREVLRLTKLEGLSIAETAARTGLSESNVKVLTHRALKALKKAHEKTDDLINELASSLSPVKPRGQRRLFAIYAAIFGVTTLAGIGTALMRGRTAGASELVAFACVQLALALIMWGSAYAVAQLSQPGQRPSTASKRFIGVAAFVLFVVLAVVGIFRIGAGYWGGMHDGGTNCSLHVGAAAMIAALSGLVFARKEAVTRAWAFGVSLALGSTAAGAMIVNLSCSNAHPCHVGLWHLLVPMAVLSACAGFAARRLLRW